MTNQEILWIHLLLQSQELVAIVHPPDQASTVGFKSVSFILIYAAVGGHLSKWVRRIMCRREEAIN
jgi:hypothetical protein